MIPLKGKRILSFETWGSGAFHAELLAMLGAEVINVEDPQQDGNPLRYMGKIYLDTQKEDNESSEFCLHNKLSIGLDIRTDEGQEILHKLAAEADAVINNFRGNLPPKLGVTYDQLKQYNKKIVCTHLSGYGNDNNRASWPGYDFLMQAETGWMSLTGEPDSELPTKVGVSVVDILGSVYGALCTTTGLLQAAQTGIGGDFYTNLFDIALNSLAYQAMWFLNDGVTAGRQPRSAHTTQTPSQIFKTSDGWIYVACLTQKFWELLCQKLNCEKLINDSRFKTNNDRRSNRKELTALLDNIFIKNSKEHWLKLLEGDIPVAPVLSVKEALSSNYIKDSDRIVEVPYHDNPNRDEAYFLKPPFSYQGIESIKYKFLPKLGENTDSILAGIGISKEQITQLKNKKILI